MCMSGFDVNVKYFRNRGESNGSADAEHFVAATPECRECEIFETLTLSLDFKWTIMELI